MFTQVYLFQYYRLIKSGLLLDFVLKKLTLHLCYLYFLIFSIFFSEKYFIEQQFLRLKTYSKFFILFFDTFSTEFAYAYLSIIILTIVLTLCFILI